MYIIKNMYIMNKLKYRKMYKNMERCMQKYIYKNI